MTSISDVNIVVQQGNSAREVQNTRTQPMDPNQATVAQQQEKESEQRTTVKEFEDPGKINPDQEREDRKRKPGSRQKQPDGSGKKGKKEEDETADADSPGKLLDTIA